MNLFITAPPWLTILLVLALLAAAVEDALRLRISNLTCAIVFISGLAAAAMHGISFGFWQNIAVCLGILLIGMPAFAAGWFGGGDIKLMAALGLWLDLSSAVALIATVLLAGGIIAAVYIAARSWHSARKGLPRRHGKVPYGLAIVAGAFILFSAQFAQRDGTAFSPQFRSVPGAPR